MLVQEKESRIETMRRVVTSHAVLLDIKEEEVALWEVNLEDCQIYIRNIVDEDGDLSSAPWVVCQVNTFDGRIFDVPIRMIRFDDDLIQLYDDIVGQQTDIWW